MTTLHADPTARPTAEDPQFHHALQPWMLIAGATVMALLFIAFYIYGQVAPGA
jgi:hypothetical protein